MFLARTLTLCSLAAALALPAGVAHADQGRSRNRGDRTAQRAPRASRPDGGRQAVPRGTPPPAARSAAPRAGQRRRGSGPVVVAPRSNRSWGSRSGPVVVFQGSRGWFPYRSYGPRVRYVSPYYAFRPRLSIGLGLWSGFAVPFPAYGYVSPYGYGYPPAYGYGYPGAYPSPYAAPYPSTSYPAQAPGSVAVTPAGYGGVSFQITPADAEVWVDGGYAGRASEFGPYDEPLTLEPGLHRIELRAPGFQLQTFDVTISAGHVIPYQGSLPPGP
ncbi:MAG: hypothetical protein R2712_21425 [Vicinamibacterales bacterium]